MTSYLKSELYRLMHYKWTYLFIGICSLLLLSSNVVLAAVKTTDSTFRYATTAFAFSNAYTSMAIVYILCISVSLLVFGNEHSNHTMKNTVTYGIPRGNIYFGKIFVQIMYAIIAFAIIAGVHVSSSYLLLENSASNDLNIYIRTFLACLPFFVFGLACANTFSFILEGSGGAVAASSGIMLAFPLVCNLLGMKFEVFAELGKLLPANIINFTHYDAAAEAMIMYWDTSAGFANCWLYGMVQTIIIVTIGYLLFRRKEIK